MTDFAFARAQMTASLAFHILFAVAGMAMPLLMAIAGYRHLKTRDPLYADLARRWAKGTAILFAVGAVSGTVLSFELGLLWPEFMAFAGPMIGLAFSLEGYAFFLEAIFLGLFLYGEGRLSPRVHWWCGVGVAVTGVASGVLVMAVNAWMHTPTGFDLAADGSVINVDPWAAFKAASFPTQALHMALAAYASVSFAVLGIHAWRLAIDPASRFHREAARIALIVAMVSTPLQILSGDLSAKHLAQAQPVKLAAMEAHFHTERGASLVIGGWPDASTQTLYGAIKIPYALSILAHGDPSAEVKGLEAFPKDEWPTVSVVHIAFQIMVACGTAMLALVGFAGFAWWRRWDVL
ncbi:MAG: cytochrome ubiquinol oxidase subunit I, partial [Myxococcota bacterium]